MSRRIFILVLVVVGALALGLLWDKGVIGFSTSSYEEPATLEDFEGLPYLSYVEDDPCPERKGVTLYNPSLSQPGLNLLTSHLVGGAHLLNMQGEVIHSWLPSDASGYDWIYSEMDEDGNLVVLVKDIGLVKLDWDSGLIWLSAAADNPFLSNVGKASYHHDFALSKDGDIYVLASEARLIGDETAPILIQDNSIVILTEEGIPRKKISLYDLLSDLVPEQSLEPRKSKYPRLRGHLPKGEGRDILHANTIEELPRDIAVGRKGDLLFCIRNLNLIGILGLDEERIVWTWGPDTLDRPHQPTVLDNGNILVFDNGTHKRKHSRVIELDPSTGEIVWLYESSPPEAFFSKLRGSNQRLANGNTLITESDRGHVFEVTPEGETVWDFWNFETNEDGLRSVIYRMTRYDPGFLRQ